MVSDTMIRFARKRVGDVHLSPQVLFKYAKVQHEACHDPDSANGESAIQAPKPACCQGPSSSYA
ncbi:hypothetical protein [Enhydrobacter sp.]|jgi:hypothetical protein|uniref:hypothetical protein n=1 Tax=Enhydrobacter sp. TaxID=1894999 RepID=UPI00260AEA3C|nr:hypothetical protein [Enhydrobacter sp.]